MLVLNLPFKALMFLTLMRPSLVLFLVLWLKLVKDFLKVRCRLALLPFLISCLIWLDLVASLPLIKERILVIILLLHFLSLMLGSVLVLMLPLLVWLTPDLRIKKSLLKCNWTIRKRLPRCKMRLKKRLLAFSRRLHARIRKTRYMHKMRCLLKIGRAVQQECRDRKSGSAGMPRPISYAVFCLKKKNLTRPEACAMNGDDKRDFLGVGWKFPVQVTAGGKIAQARYEQRIEEAIYLILSTAKGERVMLPNFGCGIHELVFAPNNAQTRGLVVQQVRGALVNSERRIDVLDVS